MPQGVDLRIRRLNQNAVMNITLHYTREWRVRQWVALRLIALAARVLGCGVDIRASEVNNKQKEG